MSAERQLVLGRPRLKTPRPVLYCRGCHYGLITRLICEVLDELGIAEQSISVISASCTNNMLADLPIDFMVAPHGRGAAAATAIKRVHPQAVVFTVQGDGDLGAIGLGHFIHALLRGERLTTIFLNNAGYGQTGGQMAPTTIPGQVTTTTRSGRDPALQGFPLHVAELAAAQEGTAYVARGTVHSPAQYQRTKRAVTTAFQKQIDGVGYSLVEIISACPTCWVMSPLDALGFIEEGMMAEYPLGEFKNVDAIGR